MQHVAVASGQQAHHKLRSFLDTKIAHCLDNNQQKTKKGKNKKLKGKKLKRKLEKKNGLQKLHAELCSCIGWCCCCCCCCCSCLSWRCTSDGDDDYDDDALLQPNTIDTQTGAVWGVGKGKNARGLQGTSPTDGVARGFFQWWGAARSATRGVTAGVELQTKQYVCLDYILHTHTCTAHTHLCTHTLTQLHRCDVASLYAQTIGADGSCMAATLGSSVVRCPFVRLSVVRTTSESQRYGQKETRAERRDRERERGDESRPNAPWCTLKMRFFPWFFCIFARSQLHFPTPWLTVSDWKVI